MRFLLAFLHAALCGRRLGAIALGLALCVAPPAGARAGSLADVLNYSWAVVGGSAESNKVEADGNAIDSTGAVIITGIFERTARFDTSLAKGVFQLTSKGDGDIFLMKFSRDGKPLWVRQFGGPGKDNAFDVTVDQRDNIILSGWFSDEVAFGRTVLKARGATDGFLAKVSPEGEVLWAQQMGGPGRDGANEVAVDPHGNILLSAMSGGTFRVGDVSFENGGFHDAYILKFDPNGRLLWARGTNGSGVERIRAIAADGRGNVYAGFQVRGTFKLGNVTLPPVGEYDGVMTKWSPNGDLLWYSQVATPGQDGVSASAGTRDGAGYFAGVLDGRTVIDGLPVESTGQRSHFILRLSPEGRPDWVVTFTGTEPAGAPEISSFPNGDVLFSAAQMGRTVVARNGKEIATVPANTKARREASAVYLSAAGAVIDRLGPSYADESAGHTSDIGPGGKTFVQTIVFRGEIAYGRDRFAGPGSRNFLLLVGTINRP